MSLSSPADAVDVLTGAWSRALSRPLLLVPPLAGAVAQRAIEAALVGDGGTAKGAVARALLTVAAGAAFAEIWLADERGPDWRRAGAAFALYVPPVFLLFLTGPIAAGLFAASLNFGSIILASGVLIATVVAGRLASGAAAVLASFALARWTRERGLLSALGDGAGLLAANAALAAGLVFGTWIAQEGVSLLIASAGNVMTGPSFFQIIDLLAEALIATAALAGCVALPLQAALETR
jgi:hypothetical protein